MTMTTLSLLLSRDALLPLESVSDPVFEEPPPIRLFKVPDTAPPFDGELSPESPDAGYTVPSHPRAPIPQAEMAAPASCAELGDWPPRFARLLTEALSGTRPARQIMPLLTQRARFHLRRLTPAFSSGQRPRVLRVLASQPSAAVVEMSVVVGIGTRTRALALRLEQAALGGQRGQWLCTDIEAA